MRLALIGPRGSGKSAVAAILARLTGLPLVSTDAAVVERAGRSVEEIVRARGWTEFREMEKRVLLDIIETHPVDLLLDCGGGLILAQENRMKLSFFETIIYLYADPLVLVRRIEKNTGSRPPLTDEKDPLEEIRHVLARRDPIYRAICHLKIDTTAVAPWEIADQIVKTFQIRLKTEEQ
jgi:shikimate kinase